MTAGEDKGRGRRRPGGGLSPDDAALWHRVARTARPLARHRITPPPVQATSPQPPAGAARPSQGEQACGAAPPLVPGAFAGLDKRTAGRLKRGLMAVEARIDLHGMTREEAREAFATFIAGAREEGKRCVLVITGKGTRSPGARAVLREAVCGWVNLPSLRPHIVAFCAARPRDGGAGAFYMLLRRRR